MIEELGSAFDWAEELGIVIYDADGWRHDRLSMHEKITREDFMHRMSMSTIGLKAIV